MASITVRNVPDETRDELAGRAARSGRSLQEYLRRELIALAERPDIVMVLERVRDRKRKTDTRLPAKRILELRDEGRR